MRNLIALLTIVLTVINSTAFALESTRSRRISSVVAPSTSIYRAQFRRVQLGQISLETFVNNASQLTESIYQVGLYDRIDLIDPDLLDRIEHMNDLFFDLRGKIDKVNHRQSMKDVAMAVAQMDRIMAQVQAAIQDSKTSVTGVEIAVGAMLIGAAAIMVYNTLAGDQREAELEQVEEQINEEKQREEDSRQNIKNCEEEDEDEEDNGPFIGSIIAEKDSTMMLTTKDFHSLTSYQQSYVINLFKFLK